ncbi:MAG TPA: hypothetical protein VIP82_04330, partial [Microbacterium sp.]
RRNGRRDDHRTRVRASPSACARAAPGLLIRGVSIGRPGRVVESEVTAALEAHSDVDGRDALVD